MADTGFKSPTATGDDHNDWTNPSDAFSSNDAYATATGIGDDFQDYYNFTFGVPSGATIDGIELTTEAKTNTSNDNLLFALSWDGGASYTSDKTQNWTTSETTRTSGGSTDTWGRSWSDTEFSNANFRARIQKEGTIITLSLDHIQVKVYYTAGGGTTFTPVLMMS